jgi:predicted lipid-binding transport protein (Tim44 family)
MVENRKRNDASYTGRHSEKEKGVKTMMGGMMGGFGSGFGGFGGFGLIGIVLNLVITVGLIVGLVLLIAWLWRRINRSGGFPARDPASPLRAGGDQPRAVPADVGRCELTGGNER